jgi:hypothetical protein
MKKERKEKEEASSVSFLCLGTGMEQVAMLLVCMREVSGSILGRDTCYL